MTTKGTVPEGALSKEAPTASSHKTAASRASFEGFPGPRRCRDSTPAPALQPSAPGAGPACTATVFVHVLDVRVFWCSFYLCIYITVYMSAYLSLSISQSISLTLTPSWWFLSFKWKLYGFMVVLCLFLNTRLPSFPIEHKNLSLRLGRFRLTAVRLRRPPSSRPSRACFGPHVL